MKTIQKIISFILIFSLVIGSVSNTAYAKEKKTESTFATRNIMSFNQAEFNKALQHSTIISINNTPITNSGCAAAAGLYFVPGVGEVLITATGVVIVSGLVICTGSWLYNKIITYFAEHTKNKRPSTYDKHTKPRPGRETEKKKNKKDWKKRK